MAELQWVAKLQRVAGLQWVAEPQWVAEVQSALLSRCVSWSFNKSFPQPIENCRLPGSILSSIMGGVVVHKLRCVRALHPAASVTTLRADRVSSLIPTHNPSFTTMQIVTLGPNTALLEVAPAAVPSAVPDATPPPGVWPLPSSIACTPATAGSVLSASLQLVATGPGSSSNATTAALARCTPLPPGGAPFDGSGSEGEGDIQTISITVATAADDLSATTEPTIRMPCSSRQGAAPPPAVRTGVSGYGPSLVQNSESVGRLL